MKRFLNWVGVWVGVLLPCSGLALSLDDFEKLSVDAEVSYVSRYMFRGFDTLDDEGAIQPSLTVNVGESGLWVNFWGSFGLDGGLAFDETKREDLDELDWSVGYDFDIVENLSASAGYTLFQFPNVGSREANINEFFLGFAYSGLPVELGMNFYYDFPVETEGPGRGFLYELTASHTVEVPCLVDSSKKQPFDLEVLVGANDGVYDVDTGGFALTHVQFGVATSIDCKYFEVVPAFYYQISTNKAVNDEDEAWVSVGLSKSF